MPTQSLIRQSLLEKLDDLAPEQISEVEDFIDFLTQKENAQDIEEVRRRRAQSAPSQHRTLDDLRRAWNQ